jgi:hypothetical protein
MELALAMSAEAAHGSSQDAGHEEGAPSSSAPAELSTDTPVAQHVDGTPDETALQSKVRDRLDAFSDALRETRYCLSGKTLAHCANLPAGTHCGLESLCEQGT